jgi:TRAP-type C4-dicarboxylate transport system permease small subunit
MLVFVEKMGRVLDRLCQIALWLGGGALVAMTLAVTWQVFGRFVLNDSPSWTEPVSLVLMVWSILVVAAVGIRERFHLGLDLFREVAPPRVRWAMDLAANVLVGAFAVAMAVYGAKLAMRVWANPMPVLGISEGWNYVPVSVCGVLIVLFSI